MNSESPNRLPPLTVSQLTNAIKLSVESTFSFVYLQGEISNFKLQSSGHLYFSLKDQDAQIAAVMFRADASLLKMMPKSGDQVIIKGALNVYPPKGNYQLIIRELSYVGLGELLQKLELLKVKLHQLGWFKTSLKKKLPRFPQRIGVVTSPTGAVIQDILNVLARRFSGFHLILNPVKVQGEGAAQEIAKAIEQFNQYQMVDVIIVGRGGGSLEDLWAFNEEIVASAIFHSQLPIISAVGHETDHCIADYVADVRAPTPSAAAEIVIAEKDQQLEYLNILRKRIQQSISHLIQHAHYRLQSILRHSLLNQPHTMLEWRMQKLDDFRLDLDQSIRQFLHLKKVLVENKSREAFALKPNNQIIYYKERLRRAAKNLSQKFVHTLEQNRLKLTYKNQHLNYLWLTQQNRRQQLFNALNLREELNQLVTNRLLFCRQKLTYILNVLKALDPKNVLEKGYSILFAEKTTFVINSVRQLSKGQPAILLMSDGEVSITINEVITCEHRHIPSAESRKTSP